MLDTMDKFIPNLSDVKNWRENDIIYYYDENNKL